MDLPAETWALMAVIFSSLAASAVLAGFLLLRQQAEQLKTCMELLVGIDNYTRKNRHAVANLTDALGLVFPEIAKIKDGRGVTPLDLEDSVGMDSHSGR